MSVQNFATDVVTLRGGRQMSRWQLVLTAGLLGVGVVLLIAHVSTLSTVIGALMVLADIVATWRWVEKTPR